MLRFWMLMVAVSVLAASLPADELIRRGEAVEVVYEKLGKPRGMVAVGGKRVLYYHLGSVEIISGVVTAFTLMSEEEYARRMEASRIREAQRIEREKADRARHLAAGRARKQRVLNDPDFVTASGAQKLSFWKRFSTGYPEVDIRADLADAVKQARTEGLAKREAELQRQRIAQLEQEVADKEQRARAAEREARRARTYNPYYASRYSIVPGVYGSVYPFYSGTGSSRQSKVAPCKTVYRSTHSHAHLGYTYNNPQVIATPTYKVQASPSSAYSRSAIQTPAPRDARTIGSSITIRY
ncbi:MAG: hypothetical protein VCG02_01120 [Verrucomicrobiota bacterium]